MTEPEAWAAHLPPHEETAPMDKIDTSTDAVRALLEGVTPGPWTVRKWAQAMTITGNVHQVVSEGEYPTAFVPAWDDPGPGGIDGTDEAKANATLIAADPAEIARIVGGLK